MGSGWGQEGVICWEVLLLPAQEPRLDAGGRLVGELDGPLQQPDGEVGMRLAGHPQAELLVRHRRLQQ
eukprot:2128261-Pyramimonas_sp.AAC.1